MKNVLVTGGAGYIGSHTVVELDQAGFAPVVVDNFSNSERSVIDRLNKLCQQPISFHEVDCNDKEAFRKVFETEKIDGRHSFCCEQSGR